MCLCLGLVWKIGHELFVGLSVSVVVHVDGTERKKRMIVLILILGENDRSIL